ncbi:MAG TPA: creatininase family protein [Polyangiaceae bacterium]|jgi:hypothetical protein|nr:creatininase family protein [Polyangiaceae bacterium]
MRKLHALDFVIMACALAGGVSAVLASRPQPQVPLVVHIAQPAVSAAPVTNPSPRTAQSQPAAADGASLWTEELTSDEVAAAIQAGSTTIVIGTGGVEDNGPYVASGKHDYVLQTVLPYVARALGHALIAPIVKFVPEGDIEPPSGHMQHAGTISLEEASFEALLTDICRSYKAHGFVDLVLIGDSGGNQLGMERVAATLNGKWASEKARVHYLREYYFEDQWSYDYLKKLGVTQIDQTPPPGAGPDQRTDHRNGIHDDVYYESQVAVQDPALIRMNQRIKSGQFSLHGVDLSPIEKTQEIGRKLAEYRAGITARAFNQSQATLRGR